MPPGLRFICAWRPAETCRVMRAGSILTIPVKSCCGCRSLLTWDEQSGDLLMCPLGSLGIKDL